MQLHTLTRHTERKKEKRVGRGGKRGTFSGRGTKGQKARAGHRIRPELRDIIKKLPKMRGRGKNSLLTIVPKPAVVNLDSLELTFNVGEVVSPTSLLAHKLIRPLSGKAPVVKILGRGALTKKLSFESCNISESAMKKITAVGGSVKAS